MKLLLGHGARMEVNYFGLTPLMDAARTGHIQIVDFILAMHFIERTEVINALELLGATYVEKKSNERDMMTAMNLWRRAMAYRVGDSDSPPIPKSNLTCTLVAAYDNATEATSEAQLDEVFSDLDQMRMQALLVRERILEPAHPDTCYYIRYRGALYADMGEFRRCILLWMYALDIQQKYLEPLSERIHSNLIYLVELFYFMRFKDIKSLCFQEVFNVFQIAIRDLQSTTELGGGSGKAKKARRGPRNIHRRLYIILHLLAIFTGMESRVLDSQFIDLQKAVYSLVSLDVKGNENRSLLHLAAIASNAILDIPLPPTPTTFPNFDVISLLLEMGASPMAMDKERNTPLHLAARKKDRNTCELLLKHGAHLDARNNKGQTAIELLSKQAKQLHPMTHISLQCLCARTIIGEQIHFDGCLSKQLERFIKIH